MTFNLIICSGYTQKGIFENICLLIVAYEDSLMCVSQDLSYDQKLHATVALQKLTKEEIYAISQWDKTN